LRLALAQTLVTPEVAANAASIRRALRRAKAEGADLVQLTEGALSGYGRKALTPFERWTGDDWAALRHHSERIAGLAGELGLWVVLGSVHPLDAVQRPHNSLYVIDPGGAVVTRYDKRLCSQSEISGWYTPGLAPTVFTAGGVRFGCALCIEVRFPEIFRFYREQAVHAVLLSSFTAGRRDEADARQDAIFGITAQAHAANNACWVAMVTPANPFQGAPTQLIDPLGHVVAAAALHEEAVIVGEIELGPGSPWAAAGPARLWREQARDGEIYRSRASRSPRSQLRTSF
jgi:predicted amidohydrolase